MTLDRTRMFAFIADGDHDGLVAVGVELPNGIGSMLAPLVSLGNENNLAWMREQAANVAQTTGKTIRLFEFTNPIEREVFAPGRAQ